MAKFIIIISNYVGRRIFLLLILLLFGFIHEKIWADADEGFLVSNNRIRFTKLPHDVTIGVRGGTVELPCSAHDERGEKVQNIWQRNGGKNGDIFEGESNGSLVLRDVKLENEGIYQCLILSPLNGVLLSGRAKLVIAKPPVFTLEPQDTQAYVGSVIQLQCTAAGVPTATISWFHNGLPLRDDIQRFITLRSGILQIIDVQTSDQGSYFCLASNAAGNVSSRIATLSTSTNLTPFESRLRFFKTPQNVTVGVGGIALFECLLERMDVEISWERADDGRFPSNLRAQKIGSNLEINKVDIVDQGMYACVGKIGSKEVLRSTAYLNVNYAPILREMPQELVKNRGEKARFSCVVSGKPRPDIIWYRDGEEIVKRGRFKVVPESNEPPDLLRTDDGEIEYKRDLIVSSLRHGEDPGFYQCVAINSYGEASAAAALIVNQDDKDVEGPTNFQAVVSQSSSTVQLSWQLPEKLTESQMLAVFLIHFYSTESNNDRTENTRAFTLNDVCNGATCKTECCENTQFEPFTKYVFWVSAVMTGTTYTPPSNEIEITTSDAVSSGVALLDVEDSFDGAVELKWADQEKNIIRGQIQEYRIEYGENREKNHETKEVYQPYLIKERSLTGLKSNTIYYFRVVPKTRAGYPSDEHLANLKEYPWIKHRTRSSSNATTPDGPLPSVFVTINKTKAFVRLFFPRSSSSVGGDAASRECSVILTRCDNDRVLLATKLTNESDSLVVYRPIEPSRYYQVSASCGGENSADSSSSSSISQLFRTPKRNTLGEPIIREPPVPFPVNLECVPISKPRSVALRWEQLPTLNNVQHFVVRYSPKGEESESLNVSAHVKMTTTSSTSIVFDDLPGGAPYLFAVQTIMRDKKSSKFSDDITCTVSLTVPSVPQGVQARPTGNSSVYVSWKTSASKSTDEKISLYYIRYKRNGSGDEAWVEIAVSGTAGGTTVTNMTTGEVYVMTVVAENKAGRSPPSTYVVVAAIDPATTPISTPHVVVSYMEGIIIGVCIALVAIVVCVLTLHCRWKRNDNGGCPVRFTTSTNDGCVKKPTGDAHRGLDHCTPNFGHQHREMQTLLPPLMENSECDSKGAVDNANGRYVSIYGGVPSMNRTSSSGIADTPILEQKEPLVVTVESSCLEEHPEQCSDLSHSPATGSSLQSWNNNSSSIDHHSSAANGHHQQHPYYYHDNNYNSYCNNNNNPRRPHYLNTRQQRRRSCHNTTSSSSSSSSMPNLTDSGIGIDECSVNNLHHHIPLNNWCGVGDPTTTNVDNINFIPPPRNGYYAKHLTWLKDFLLREQQQHQHTTNNKLVGDVATNFNATY